MVEIDKPSRAKYLRLKLFCALLIFGAGMFFFGYRIVVMLEVLIVAHEETEGIPIEVSHIRDITVTYVYVVNGKEYQAKMSTSTFSRTRDRYTVVYKKNEPAKSFLKEHLMASMFFHIIITLMLSIPFGLAFYCIVKKNL